MQQQSLNEQLRPDYQRCFGCGAENKLGLQLNLYERAGAGISRWEPRPEYANFWGIVHGGVLTVALDELAGTAAWLAFRRRGGQQPFVVSVEYTVRFRAGRESGSPSTAAPERSSPAIATPSSRRSSRQKAARSQP
jgi:hypothetical protein